MSRCCPEKPTFDDTVMKTVMGRERPKGLVIDYAGTRDIYAEERRRAPELYRPTEIQAVRKSMHQAVPTVSLEESYHVMTHDDLDAQAKALLESCNGDLSLHFKRTMNEFGQAREDFKQGRTIENRREELERFKTEINLTEYAAHQGYHLDKRNSYRNAAVMRTADDKINISKGEDGHWKYYSWKDGKGGSIIDFVQSRKDQNLDEVRKELRPWINEATKPEVSLSSYQQTVEPMQKDKTLTEEYFNKCRPVLTHDYLKNRGIDFKTLTDDAFKMRVMSDDKGNAVFAHINDEGLSGLEVHNEEYKGFVKGGEKGLWVSNCKTTDQSLVITESPIDALSYHQLHQPDNTRYISIGGNMSDSQKDILQRAIEHMPEGSEIVIATDHDPSGHRMAHEIHSMTRNRDDLKVSRETPEHGKDWNDELKHHHQQEREISKQIERQIEGPELSL